MVTPAAIICAAVTLATAGQNFIVVCIPPTPAPTVAPTTPPTPIPTIAPTPAPTINPVSVVSQCASSIVNGKPLPACISNALFPGGIYRRIIPDNPSLDPSSAKMIAAYFGMKGSTNDVINGLMVHNGISQYPYSYGRPFYVATASDPVVTFHCVTYCVQGSAVGIHIPANALQEGGSDAHLAIYQPDNVLIDLWGVSGNPPWKNGQTISAGTVAFSTIDGSSYSTADIIPGWMKNGVTAGGAVTPNGIIALSELQNGIIPHELFTSLPCTASTWDSPATQTARVCSDGRVAIPNGALLWYALTPQQITSSSMSPESKVIAMALHTFGARVSDTGGSNGLALQIENQAPFWSYGSGQDPFISYAQSHGWSHITNASATPPVDRYTHILQDLDLPDNLRVLSSGN